MRYGAVVAAILAWFGCAEPGDYVAPPGPQLEPRPNVSGDDVHGIPARQLEELLEGRVAGVSVVHYATGGVALRIWGPSTFYGDNEPLYVLDGLPLNVAPGRGLYWLDPNDIERIEVLKDVSATSMYGVRGGNGVVLITTRHGKLRPH